MPRKRVLSERALEVLEYVILHKRENDGNSPTVREIMRKCQISSTSMVHYYLDQLQYFDKIHCQGIRNIVIVGAKGWSF
jgi:hypothetical protein